jgi:hexulose-6-phosphate isomerase
MALLGIMQGRLLPPMAGRFQCFPRGHWQQEFPLAAEAKLDTIEWIFDAYGADENPLGTDAGIAHILALSKEYRVQIKSLCADWFMDFPVVRTTPEQAADRMRQLYWLLGQSRKAGISRVVLPFVDASKITDDQDTHSVIEILNRVLPLAERLAVELHLETSLAPHCVAELLAKIPHPLLKINYDSGNSAALGYDVREEFSAYGKRIGSVHLKDRQYAGGTVPLGKGNADFKALFECLQSVRYEGDFILQAARGTAGDELAWVKQNIELVKPYLQPWILN